ncbi:MAG: hypothetical protein DCC55_02230 [Chloroflexi bacterium]|nr:MAG: hypothetical protein DCC55_02230 [Chloroflexota bacterium]
MNYLIQFVKYAIGLFYLVGGPLIHAYFMTQQRALYSMLADQAWPLYQTLWNNLVLPNLMPLVVLLVIFEMAAGWLMVSRRPQRAQLGQLAGLIFNLLLIPFWFFYGLPNLLLVLAHGGLLFWERFESPTER